MDSKRRKLVYEVVCTYEIESDSKAAVTDAWDNGE